MLVGHYFGYEENPGENNAKNHILIMEVLRCVYKFFDNPPSKSEIYVHSHGLWDHLTNN